MSKHFERQLVVKQIYLLLQLTFAYKYIYFYLLLQLKLLVTTKLKSIQHKKIVVNKVLFPDCLLFILFQYRVDLGNKILNILLQILDKFLYLVLYTSTFYILNVYNHIYN